MQSSICPGCSHTDIEVPASPVPGLLGSNQIASTIVAPTIRTAISLAQSDILRLDSGIASLERTTDELRQKRDALQTFATMHLALVSPIHRMPPEILSDIFLHHCLSARSIDHNRDLSFDKAPLLLGNICNKWRMISLSTPRLWTFFRLNVLSKHLENHVMLAKTWFARAGACPLTIALQRNTSEHVSLEPLMQVILLHCERWHDVSLIMPISNIKCLAPARNCIPRLQRLFIQDCGSSHYTKPIDIFENAPQLRSFDLRSTPISIFKIPYHQLKHSKLFTRKADETLEYLSLTPNLETCEVSPVKSECQHAPVLLRHLRYLCIEVGMLEHPGTFFDRLILPMLRELYIWLWNIPWTGIPELISLLSRGSLEKFKFYSNPTNRHPLSVDMIKVLLASPTIAELDLTGSSPQCMTESFLTRFAYNRHLENGNAPQLLPALHTIKVDYTRSFFDVLAFADAVQSRMAVNDTDVATSGVCLKTVEMRCFAWFGATEPLDSIALSRLQQLQDLGLDLRIIYGRNVCGEFTI